MTNPANSRKPAIPAICHWRAIACALALTLTLALAGGAQSPAFAQAPPVPAPPVPAANAAGDWSSGVEIKKTAPAAASPKANTTVIERSGGDAKGGQGTTAPSLKLVALLTDNGQEIDQGIVWRVFQHGKEPNAKSKLVVENREASPSLKLPPGDYTVNAAFGRANLTRKVTIKGGALATEQFVLNAGGLRLSALTGGKPAPAGLVTYAVYSDDHDQFDSRTAVMANAKPGLIVRLNAGIYRVVSTYGDANAKVESDVTVEAGKLTEATVAHVAGKVSFKLVTRAGGEALPDTHWTIQTSGGEEVKESVGALPTHMLAPGDYMVSAKSAGHLFTRSFTIKDGDTLSVEVLMDKNAPPATPASAATTSDGSASGPNFEIKIP